MAKEQVNPNRACPACAEMRAEVTELAKKVEALELAARLGPNAPRCACGNLATRAATVTHSLAGPRAAQLLCDACDAVVPVNCTIAFESLPEERLALVRRINAGLGA
jgi:hypothetical protein